MTRRDCLCIHTSETQDSCSDEKCPLHDIIFRPPASSNRLVMTQLWPCGGERKLNERKKIYLNRAVHTAPGSAWRRHITAMFGSRGPLTSSHSRQIQPADFQNSGHNVTLTCIPAVSVSVDVTNTCELSDSTDTMSFGGVQINMHNLSRLAD